MKNFILFLFGIPTVFLMVSWFCHQTKYEIPSREKAVNTAVGYNIRFIQDRYKLISFGTTIAMPEGDIEYLELKFQIYGPLKKDVLRKMLLEVANDFLANLNQDIQLCAFLDKGKLDISEIGIELFLIDKCKRGVDHPNIAIASISKGQLEYLTLGNNEKNYRDFVSAEQESFEEAIQILRSQNDRTVER